MKRTPDSTSRSGALCLLVIAVLTAIAACSPPSPVTPAAATLTPIPPQPTASPTPSPTATPGPPACLSQPGLVLDDVAETSLVPKPMRLKVYLPPCYLEDSPRRYPVLYLLHGLSYDETQWVRLGAPQSADLLITSEGFPPFIIVMPYNYGARQPTQDGFGQAVVTVLVPYIDGRYRTLADRAHRAVGGLSRGGGWAIHLGTREWALFGAFGGHSPAIFRTDAALLVVKLREIPADSHPRIYLDIGDADSLKKTVQDFDTTLTEMDFEHEWHVSPGTHNEAYWGAHVEAYLRWYAAGW